MAGSWVIEVRSRCDPHQFPMRQQSPNLCIYKVPNFIRELDSQAYAPTVISLGPYHHDAHPELSAMDEYKCEAVRRTLTRFNGCVTLDTLIAKIKEREKDIRDCYDSKIEWDGERLAWMLAMDGCFILEYIRSFVENQSDQSSFSLVFQSEDRYNKMKRVILNDIMKLENQIPLFILRTIMQLEPGSSDDNAVCRLARMLNGNPSPLKSASPFNWDLGKEEMEKCIRDACHLLDLLRNVNANFLTPTTFNSTEKRVSIPRAELLQKAGVKFEIGEVQFNKRSKFRSGIFYLPRIHVADSAETRLRNLLAYEECQRCSLRPKQTIISQYMHLMNDLIDIDKDVSLLRKSDVIESSLGTDKDTATMFNKLSKRITSGDHVDVFTVARRKAKEHYDSKLKNWRSEFKEEYFSKPWHAVSLLVGIIILVMTVVQAVSSLIYK